ncbi:MAG: hypothetical protein HYX27_24715 [Acidobacteria bacterium]|nr:hypothetical protein [Acidobacteriota bacterium]
MQISLLIAGLVLAAAATSAEPKVRLFITESGALQISSHAMALTGPTSAENIEVMKAFQKHCPAVAITADREKADFIVRLDRETPSPVTPFVRGNKVAVFNRDADLIYSSSSRTLAPAVKGACAAVRK